MMVKLNNNEKGFGIIEGLLIVAVVVLLGYVGYMVYKNHNKTTTPTTTSTTTTPTKTTTAPTKTTPTTTQESNYVNVIQSDSSVTQETPAQIAKTTDQANILKALHDSCSGQSTANVTVNIVVFDGSPNFKQDGTHAVINAGVCDKVGKTIDDVGGGGADRYLHKNSSGTWIFDASSTGLAIDCTKVDGLGYPTTILSTCYDSTTSSNRAIK